MTDSDLKQLAKEHPDDAKSLQSVQRFAGAIYLAGYAVECALKFRICQILGWRNFPPGKTQKGSSHTALKSHDLDFLLSYTGKLLEIKKNHLSEWQDIEEWGPEMRYDRSKPLGASDCSTYIGSVTTLTGLLL